MGEAVRGGAAIGAALFDLEEQFKLISKQEKLTRQEEKVFGTWQAKAVRDFIAGSLVGVTAVFSASRILSKAIPIRVTLSAGSGPSFGLWLLDRSCYSSADRILTMDGSILQRELADIMVTKYQNDPSVMQLISKHFYLERIFDDSTSNSPRLRWRYRNFFSDNAVHGHETHDHESYDKSQGDSQNDSKDKSQGGSENVTNSKRTNLETKHIAMKAGPDVMSEVDPLDCLFGYAAPVESTQHSNSPNKPSGIHNRGHRRFHRRRRMRNHEDLSESQHAAAV